MSKKYDFLIVGCGLFGSVFAYQMHKAGKKILIIDKRNHIGGNVYTENINNINVHKYGAHIFHTNNKKVWEFVNKFAEFNNFVNSPVANYENEIYSLPFNMYTFNKIWGVITPQEAIDIINKQRAIIKHEPKNLEEQAISLVGTDVYEKLVKSYTEKQWGRACSELPPDIIKRLPVRFTYDNNYFNALYQGIPIGGYTKMIENMIRDIDIELNIDYLEHRNKYNVIADKIIYTGPIDAYFDYCEGNLEYRSVRFETQVLDIDNYQGNAVVNYTDANTEYTRIIEHKWFEFGKDCNNQNITGTIISKEYSSEWDISKEPYYPINNIKNIDLYNKYKSMGDQEANIIFGGRLGTYKYYDMDAVIATALDISEKYK